MESNDENLNAEQNETTTVTQEQVIERSSNSSPTQIMNLTKLMSTSSLNTVGDSEVTANVVQSTPVSKNNVTVNNEVTEW